MSSPNPYQEKKCWHHLKVGNKGTKVIVCGLDARLYRVTKKDDFSNYTRSFSFTVWLCSEHRESIERNGYSPTLITIFP